MEAILLGVGGLVLLLVGAELLVRSGSRLATRLGLSPMVIGLTVVSVGTSACPSSRLVLVVSLALVMIGAE